MIRVFRIDRQKHHDTFLEGIGAARYGGRWNKPGIPVIYTSESRALAMLEVLVNIRKLDFLPKDYVMITIEVDADVISVPVAELPSDWKSLQYTPETQHKFGDFINKFSGIVLKVPSVVIPQEYNYLIDPLTLKGKISLKEVHPLKIDERF